MSLTSALYINVGIDFHTVSKRKIVPAQNVGHPPPRRRPHDVVRSLILRLDI
jgi:hypothetical protein